MRTPGRKRASVIYLFCFMLLLPLMTGCGMRGDPVAIKPAVPVQPAPLLADIDSTGTVSQSDKSASEAESADITPSSPDGLRWLYVDGLVILTWNEVPQAITHYAIYRSGDSGFQNIGDSVIPAYTDRDVVEGRTYLYKVSAVGSMGSMMSEIFKIKTED